MPSHPMSQVTKPDRSAIQAVKRPRFTIENIMKKQSEQQKQRTNNLVRKAFASKIKRQKKLAEKKRTAG